MQDQGYDICVGVMDSNLLAIICALLVDEEGILSVEVEPGMILTEMLSYCIWMTAYASHVIWGPPSHREFENCDDKSKPKYHSCPKHEVSIFDEDAS